MPRWSVAVPLFPSVRDSTETGFFQILLMCAAQQLVERQVSQIPGGAPRRVIETRRLTRTRLERWFLN